MNNDTSNWFNIVWLALLLVIFMPSFTMLFNRSMLRVRRRLRIRSLEKKFNCRIITLIHRQESLGLFGIPLFRYINMEDAESIIEAVHLTSSKLPIYFIIHTPGGLALAAEQIARALNAHRGGSKLFVPYYAMSGGTLVGLGSSEIVMMPNAVLGPIDPQIPVGIFAGTLPASSILKALEEPNPHREDRFLALGDVSRKALSQMKEAAFELLRDKVKDPKTVADTLSQGTWTHDYPITYEKAKELGLPVSNEFPIEILRLMRLYKQPAGASAAEYEREPYGGL